MIACVAKCNGFPQNVVRILRSAKLDFWNGLQSENGAFWCPNDKKIEFIIYAKTRIAGGCLQDKFAKQGWPEPFCGVLILSWRQDPAFTIISCDFFKISFSGVNFIVEARYGKRLFPYVYQEKISFFEFQRNVRNVTETGAANHTSYKKQTMRHVRPICFW